MNVLTSSHQIDVQDLLQPIPGANPAGESLRYQGTYDRIADARREDDPSLSQGIYKSTLKRADWTTAEAICVEALTNRIQRSTDCRLVARSVASPATDSPA